MSKNEYSQKRLEKDIHTALKNWYTVKGKSDHSLENLYLVQNKMREQESAYQMSAQRLHVNEVLQNGLRALEAKQPEAADILKRRFQDDKSMATVGKEMKLSPDQVKHKQKSAIKALANIIWVWEQDARELLITRQEGQLEAKSYTELFGIDALSDELLAFLTRDDSPWVISLVGIGGIGKTSLANFTVRRAISKLYYEDVIWHKVSNILQRPYPPTPPEQTFQRIMNELSKKLLPALPNEMDKMQRFEHLQHLLKSRPHLIIIDNLEMPSDTSYLLSELVTLANPSRFLLTSRIPPRDHAGSQSICLTELGQQDSLALIRHYANEIRFFQAAKAQDEDLLPIFELVGGNPFALKQMVGLAQKRPLPSLLQSIRQRPLGDGEEIYQHILEETWLTLSNEAKAVLTVITLAADGGMDPDQILYRSKLPESSFWPAINELISRSLLEVRSSSIWERFYGIHRLTELFIRSLLDKDNDDELL